MRIPILLVVAACLSQTVIAQVGLPPRYPAQSSAPGSEQTTYTLPTTQGNDAPVPKWVTYRIFFNDIGRFEKAAEASEANGEDGSGWRNFAQFKTGITSNEAVILKQIAFDCNRAIEENEKRVQAVLKGVRARLAQGIRPAGNELNGADHEQQIVEDHIKQLKDELSEASFNSFDNYVYHRFNDRPKIRVPLRRSSPSDISSPPPPNPPPAE